MVELTKDQDSGKTCPNFLAFSLARLAFASFHFSFFIFGAFIQAVPFFVPFSTVRESAL
jgi:hypothetical protein